MRETWIILFFSLFGIEAFSQSANTTVKGLVLDENGQPLPGVIVKVGKNASTLTNLDGIFELSASSQSELSLSYIGYQSEQVKFTKGKDVVVRMVPKGIVIEPEQKVMLYDGKVSKDKHSQSVFSISGETISHYHGEQLYAALAGRVPGFNVNFNSGKIGEDNSGLNFKIRGLGGQMVLIDGVELGYTSLDPEQIESVTIMKDAMSSILMGGQSSKGIIYIETKKGKLGKPRFSFTAEGGFRQLMGMPDVLPAWQYAELYNEAYLNDNPTANQPIGPEIIQHYKDHSSPYLYPEVDWYDQVLNKNASSQRYNFNLSGGNKTFTYFVDVDYMFQNGFFKTRSENQFNTNESSTRFIIRSNVGAKLTEMTHLQVNFLGRSLQYNEPASGTNELFTSMFNTPQNAYPIFNEDGSLATTPLYGENANIWGKATYGGHKFSDKRNYSLNIVLDQDLKFLLNGLYLKLQGAYDIATKYLTTRAIGFASYYYDPASQKYNIYGEDTNQTSAGDATSRSRNIYFKGVLGYENSFGKHNLGVKFLADRRNTLSYQLAQLPEIYSNLSLKGNYSLDNKYLLEAAISFGGHNWYTSSNRWHKFWAVGASWNMHNEKFMQNIPWISYLKPRVSYGLIGFEKPSYYEYIETYTLSSSSQAHRYLFNGLGINGAYANNITNTDLSPEMARKLNVGIDFGFFDNRLSMSGDFYLTKYSDLIKVPAYTTGILGETFPRINYQKYDYWGGEYIVTWQDKIKDFNYHLSANMSFSQSEVIYNQELAKDYPWQITTGKPEGIRFGYQADGIFKSYEEIEAHNAFFASAPKSTIKPGDIRYKDLNKDNLIDENDRGAIGTTKPQGYYGIEAGLEYKGVDMNILFQGTINREVYLSGDFMNGFGNNGKNNAYVYNLGRFTEETAQTATQPRLWLGDNVNNTAVSTFWQKNGDFIRLKNLELGYTFPYKLTKVLHIPSIRLFMSANNLLTFSEIYDVREDLDPEAWGGGYPITKSFMFGVNLKF